MRSSQYCALRSCPYLVGGVAVAPGLGAGCVSGPDALVEHAIPGPVVAIERLPSFSTSVENLSIQDGQPKKQQKSRCDPA